MPESGELDVSSKFSDHPEFNKTWAAMTRKIHIYHLAKPAPRRLKPFPDPAVYIQAPRPIPKEALRYEPTERIKLMSIPPPSKMRGKWVKPPDIDSYVQPAALVHNPSPRILELAKPVGKKPGVGAEEEKRPKKSKKALKKEREMLKKSLSNREAWMARMAAPKPFPPQEHKHPPRPKFIIRGTKMYKIKEKKMKFVSPKRSVEKIPYAELLDKCARLAVPTKRREKFKVEKMLKKIDSFEERRTKRLTAPISENIRRLAVAKQLPDEAVLDLKYKPFRINKAALKYKPTERVVYLATPIIKQKRQESEIKENPFGVVKRALTAVCSKRVAELARPVTRE